VSGGSWVGEAGEEERRGSVLAADNGPEAWAEGLRVEAIEDEIAPC